MNEDDDVSESTEDSDPDSLDWDEEECDNPF